METNVNDFTLEILRHSTAHILAAAVTELFPETRIAIGPAIEEGFYYDFDRPVPFTPEDLNTIEKKMEKIIKANYEFVRTEKTKDEAISFFEPRGEKYKIELIKELPAEKVSFYQSGAFIDMCRGPHIPSTGKVKHFKLLSLAGAYWRGDANREQLQRIYGTAFFSKEEMEEYLKRIEEAKKRDHRRLGKALDLFSLHEEVGGGLVHWHPKGTLVRHLIEDYWRKLHYSRGYELVVTPHIASEETYRISGHLENYIDFMYGAMDIEGRPYRVKPMNCPGHIMIYKTRLHSYRELPIRIAEMGTVYRFEKGGVLHGLMRVRGFTIDDAHILVAPDQVEEEMIRVLTMALDFLRAFGFSEFAIFLATRPQEKYVGKQHDWEMAEKSLRIALEKSGLPFEVDEGGGAFYGPKIDVKVKDSIGRLWQCSTIQFDFNLPERFDITYIDQSNKKARPYMIHRALMGSMERFFGVLIEHYGGAFPLWLAPVQVVVMNITDKQLNYGADIVARLKADGFRVEFDARNEKVGLKIREATMQKVPYLVIVGDREVEAGAVAVRTMAGQDIGTKPLAEFIQILKDENKSPEYRH